MCNRCYSFDWSWQPVAGTGTVVSFIRTHHPFLAYMKAPYYTVFVAVDEQPDRIPVGGEPQRGDLFQSFDDLGEHGHDGDFPS